MWIATTLVLAALVLGLLAIAMTWILGWANVRFHVEVDPRVERIQAALPGANCGGCGFVGCSEYAVAVVRGEAALTLCAPGGDSCAQELGAILGVEVTAAAPYRAVIHCSADWSQRLGRTPYRGEATCAAANLVSDYQGCTFGCLGLADCARVCEYDAIHVENGLARVDYERCIGCRACENVCPRNLITMVPFRAEHMLVVACSNQDLGKDVQRVCLTGCIGCKLCTRGNDLLHMEGNLPVVDYDRYDPDADYEPILEKCSMESLLRVGRPTPEQIAAVAEEEVADRIEADFRTTVDDTEWRG